ncbi:MAG: UDP-N-acetylmuramate dehydrogenase [Elusimicrobiaceae bacterium]|nr:UDP-N-acetylmuramate dehydrogenase [Elusimicrobiaceae bacterium]
MKMNTFLENLKEVPFIFEAQLSFFTTYHVGGEAEVLALPETEEQIKQLVNFTNKKHIPFRVLGLGSNILVSDLGLRGITCCLKNFKGIKIDGNKVTASAGTALDEVVRASIDAGLGGLENLSGIPGSVGGAVFMNAGAFKTETFDKLISFKILDIDGNIKELKKEEVKYAYRKVWGLENCVILSATWELEKTDKIVLVARRADILKSRAEKQPLDYPSAGSVFKRPVGAYASKLIDDCGLRGLSVGGAQVSTKHAGFIINYQNATAQDIYDLIKEVQKIVKKKTGFTLEPEQIFWGKFK